MPVIHEYTDERGFYILAVPYGISTPVTYQVSQTTEELFHDLDLVDGDNVSWSFLKPLLAVGHVYTQASGVTDTEQLFDEIGELSDPQHSQLITYLIDFLDITGEEESELREFINGETHTLSNELANKVQSGLDGNTSSERTTSNISEDGIRKDILSTQEELVQYLISLFDLSEDQIRRLQFFLQGNLVKLDTEIAASLNRELVIETSDEATVSKKEKLHELVSEMLFEISDTEASLNFWIDEVVDPLMGRESMNYQYWPGHHFLMAMSEERSKAAKSTFKQWGADLTSENEFSGDDGAGQFTFETHSGIPQDAQQEVDRIVTVLREVYDAELADVQKCHIMTPPYNTDVDPDCLLKLGWEQEGIDF
jgi:hypothetical protein